MGLRDGLAERGSQAVSLDEESWELRGEFLKLGRDIRVMCSKRCGFLARTTRQGSRRLPQEVLFFRKTVLFPLHSKVSSQSHVPSSEMLESRQ